MIAPDALIAELMVRVRRDLFSTQPDKAWYQQQDTVKKALTFPAAWLEERHVPLSSERYKAILDGILDTAKSHGQIGRLTYPGAYLLHCVQKHMQHHGDSYYQEGKAIRNRTSVFMSALEAKVAGRKSPAVVDNTVPVFAAVHNALAIGKSKGRPKSKTTPAGPLQPDLFGRAKPLQKG